MSKGTFLEDPRWCWRLTIPKNGEKDPLWINLYTIEDVKIAVLYLAGAGKKGHPLHEELVAIAAAHPEFGLKVI
uniref:Uncharacterized protein n=1 Tax=viral metagenome TaxID=1070528 RepID=A0A6M3KB97_9ZZZZ